MHQSTAPTAFRNRRANPFQIENSEDNVEGFYAIIDNQLTSLLPTRRLVATSGALWGRTISPVYQESIKPFLPHPLIILLSLEGKPALLRQYGRNSVVVVGNDHTMRAHICDWFNECKPRSRSFGCTEILLCWGTLCRCTVPSRQF